MMIIQVPAHNQAGARKSRAIVSASERPARAKMSTSAATSYRHVPKEALKDVEHIHITGITPALLDRQLRLDDLAFEVSLRVGDAEVAH